jgi:hypothetical protein
MVSGRSYGVRDILFVILPPYNLSFSALIGGGLSNPGHHFPTLFKGDFWKDHPYFLPCLVVGIIVIVSLLLVFIFFKEVSYPSVQISSDLILY